MLIKNHGRCMFCELFFMQFLDVLKDTANSSGFVNSNFFFLGESLIC